jgi:uncharacterized protein (DUF1800 family)
LRNIVTPWPIVGSYLLKGKRHRLLILSGAALSLGLGLGLAPAAQSTTPPTASVITSPVGPGISFFTKKTRLWQGRSQIIYFQVAQPAVEDRYYSFQVDEKAIHLLIPPRILKGEKIGYLRVEPLTSGKSRIGVEDAHLDVDIVQDTTTIAGILPRIVTPASGANVWGEFAVGVEQLSLADPADLPIPTLRLPSGKEIAGHVVPDQKPGPHARWAFTVNADELAPGGNELVAVVKDSAGREVRSNSIYVDAIRPTADAMQAGACQDSLDTDRTANDGGAPPKAVNDDKYNQGMVLDNAEEGRSWCLPVWITKKGQYQMLVTTRGEFGGDGLPTLAIQLDEEGQVATSARLATTEWQRTPVGKPFTMDAGGHVISVRIRNGFSEGPIDQRSLFIQKYELVRVDQSAVPLASNSGGSMMMAPPAARASEPAMAGSMMSPTADTGGPMMSMMAPKAASHMAGDLHVVFANNIDGQMVTGAVDVEALCFWPGRDNNHAPPPRVELYVNNTLASTQSGRHPRFTVDPAAFKAGPNVLELHATLPSGDSAKSVPITLNVPPDFPLTKRAFRPSIVFTHYDSGLKVTDPPQNQDDPEVTTLYSNGTCTIKLPDNLAGKYKVLIQARGDQYDGPPLCSVELKSNGKEDKLGEFPVASTKLASVPGGTLDLTAGAKDLVVGFTNDKADAGKGDRNLYIQSVQLAPTDDTLDKTPPKVAIAYSPKTVSNGVDAVVARVMDDQRVAHADLLIDDKSQGLSQNPLHGLGPVVFPLLTRDLKPGAHHLKVVAQDDAGNLGASPEIPFTVSAPSPTAPLGKYERAVFLLNRFGYGPEPGEVAAILTMGEQNWLASRLAQASGSPAEQNEEEMMRTQFPNQHDGGQVVTSAIQYLLTEPNPVRARFVMWAENHFSTWMNKDGSTAKAQEHASFVQLGTAPFFDLLFTSSTSPAMLVYLDQRYSYAHRLNENYAREIMELHTLGVKGGYTQKDVTTLADLLTGWSLADEAPIDGAGGELDRTFSYDPHLNSANGFRVFGVEFPGTEPAKSFDRPLMALEMLSAHPSCAAFISRKLCEQYVADPAPPKLVDDLAQVYLETGGDIPSMLMAMAQHPDFWASPGKVASPIDFAVRSARMARATNPGPVNDLISSSGMGMFDRATPDGYPEDNGYSVNSNALLQRWRFAKSIQNDFLGAGLIPDSWRPAVTKWDADSTQRIVDLAAVRMTGNVLSEASNDAAQKLLAGAPPQTDVRLHALATFICQLPENSLK